ncbi:MAG: hypothetical protein AB1634_07960 [Thermodesulfobacteriota bacterium]
MKTLGVIVVTVAILAGACPHPCAGASFGIDLKANGSDGPVTLWEGDPLDVTIGMRAGDLAGWMAGWTINLHAQLDSQSHVFNWQGTWRKVAPFPPRFFRAPVISFSDYSILATDRLPPALYRLEFAVTPRIVGTRIDSVIVAVEPRPPTDSRVVPMVTALPPPFAGPLPSDPGQKADYLASEILFGRSANILPLLERALLEAGIGIRDSRSGELLFLEMLQGNAGVCLMDWEVVCLARSTTSGLVMNLEDLAAVLGFSELGLDAAKALDVLATGLAAAVSNEADPSLRFRALFVDALSVNGFGGQHLAGNQDPYAPVSHLQAALLILQYLADLGGFLRQDLGWSEPASAGAAIPVQAAAAGVCDFDDATSSIMDWSAVGSSYGLGKLLDYLHDAGLGAADGGGLSISQKIGVITGAASAGLALIKYIASAQALQATLDMDGGEPLVRTTSSVRREGGERRVLRASARFDLGNWSALNCARLALNAVNTDFNLPTSGPVGGVRVSWSLDVGSTNFGADVLDNSTVRFYSLDGQSMEHMRTDSAGLTSIGLEGAPQPHELQWPLRPDMKTARVSVRFAINSQKLMSDICAGLGAWTSGPFALVTVPVEILSRIPMQGRTLTIPVQDWLEHNE